MQTSSNYYRTKDLAEASALFTAGVKIIEVQKTGGICWFLLDDAETCKKLSAQFFFGNLGVNAREYYESMNRLKNRIFSM